MFNSELKLQGEGDENSCTTAAAASLQYGAVVSMQPS